MLQVRFAMVAEVILVKVNPIRIVMSLCSWFSPLLVLVLVLASLGSHINDSPVKIDGAKKQICLVFHGVGKQCTNQQPTTNRKEE